MMANVYREMMAEKPLICRSLTKAPGLSRRPANCEAGGWGGIRTHEALAGLPVFKTGAFNRSATHPSTIFNALP